MRKDHGHRAGALLLALAIAGCAAGEDEATPAPVPPPPPGARVVFLNFSNGGEALHQAAEDDPAANRARLCAAPQLGPWQGIPGCGGGREGCLRLIADAVDQHFADFNLVVRTTRPAEAPYTMVVIAPPSGTCRFGTNGVAPLDCADQRPAEVALVTDCRGSAARCAAIISQEIAHTYGLEHTTWPCDLMADAAAACEQGAAFADVLVPSEARCGRRAQNSYRRLLEALGPWPAGVPRLREWHPR
jgi:hypothetical protein